MDRKKIKILIVEDDPDCMELTKAMLSSNADFTFEIEAADRLSSAMELIRNNNFDLILLDLELPDSDGLDTFIAVRMEFPEEAIMVVTAMEKVSKQLRQLYITGDLQCYLIKGRFTGEVLAWNILYALDRHEADLIQRKKRVNLMAEVQRTVRECIEAENKYRVIFDNSALAITVTDENECIVSWNRFAEGLLGMDHNDLYLKSVSSLYSEEEWERIRSMNIRKEGMRHHLETVVRKKDGTELDIDISISVLKDAEGNVKGSIGLMRDISARKKLERESKNKLRRSGLIIELMRNLELGMTADQMLDKIIKTSKAIVRADTASVIILDEKRDKLPKIVASFSSGLKLDNPIVTPSLNAEKSITGWVIENKQPLLLYGACSDDERFKQIKWKTGIKCSINVPIISRGTVKGTINLNITTSECTFTKDDLEAVKILAHYVAIALENSGLYKNMKDMYIDELKNSNDKMMITNKKLKEARDQLVQSNKLASIGQLASGVAHEINNPLSGVLGNIQIILMELKAGGKIDDLQDLLTVIEESAKRCKGITQNLLEFSRVKGKGQEAFDVQQVLDRVIMLIGYSLKNANIDLNRKYKDDLPKAVANTNEIQQVFLNMLSNAKWAIDKKEGPERSITIETRKLDDKYIEVDFADTGIGMSKESQIKIFDPFYTTKGVGVGTGLGLYLCVQIMEKCQGQLLVDSEEGKGTVFHIRIPVG